MRHLLWILMGAASVYSISHTTICMVTASRHVSYLEETLQSY